MPVMTVVHYNALDISAIVITLGYQVMLTVHVGQLITGVNPQIRILMIEQKFTINGYKFVYIPSLKVLGVTTPTGGLTIHHQVPTYIRAGELAARLLVESL